MKFQSCYIRLWKKQEILQKQRGDFFFWKKVLHDKIIFFCPLFISLVNVQFTDFRCSLFLVDHDAGELIAKVFDGIEREEVDYLELRILF